MRFGIGMNTGHALEEACPGLDPGCEPRVRRASKDQIVIPGRVEDANPESMVIANSDCVERWIPDQRKRAVRNDKEWEG